MAALESVLHQGVIEYAVFSVDKGGDLFDQTAVAMPEIAGGRALSGNKRAACIFSISEHKHFHALFLFLMPTT
jgi:hypothetical protein